MTETAWTRRTVASEPRLSEIVWACEDMGFEVRLERVDANDPGHVGEMCSVCLEDPESLKSARVVYARPRDSF